MSATVRYSKEMRDRAIREGKFLVTMQVTGKHMKDDAVCVQLVVDTARAKELSDYALGLLIKAKP